VPAKSKEEYNAYMSEYGVNRYHARRKMFILEMGSVCVVCGSEDNIEFDHVDPAQKSFNIAKRLQGAPLVTLRLELEKCQLLCSKCHKTKSIRNDEVEHGGGKSGKRNCPCVPCKARKSEYSKERSGRVKASVKA